MRNYATLLAPTDAAGAAHWTAEADTVSASVLKHLWDTERGQLKVPGMAKKRAGVPICVQPRITVGPYGVRSVVSKNRGNTRRFPPRGRNGTVDRSAVRREVGLFEGLAGALTRSP